MLRAISLAALLLAVTEASAQYGRPPPEAYPRPDAYYRGTQGVICLVERSYARYRSRPTCELSTFQPPGTGCACPSYDSGGQRVLPGQVVRR